ncbi:MAG: DUF1553 domain-containing protein, partial [Planctomycetaceae bacterium]|nr:DUF1553 domain-containing protein [Planctomycetaceae bacterium]
QRGPLHGTLHGNARLENGQLIVDGQDSWFGTAPLAADVGEKTLEAWVLLDDLDQRGGGVISLQTLDGVTFDAIVFGEREPRKWMAGSNGFTRTMPFGGEEEKEAAEKAVHVAIVYQADGTIIGYRNGQRYGMPYRPRELQGFQAGQAQIAFGLRHAPAGGNRLLKARIERGQLYRRALSDDEIALSAGVADRDYVSTPQLLAAMNDSQRQQHEQLLQERMALLQEQDTLETSRRQKLYSCVPSDPGVMHVLRRGDVGSPAEVVAPAGLRAIAGLSADFGLTPDAPEQDRRRKLAEWITSRGNPLFSRVIVNRLWQYHFGHGIVTTTSDFGFNGGRPSHPDLLDWLASQLPQDGFHLKSIHRLIVTSATWRQSAEINEEGMRIDADNRLLWRRTPQRLNAEEIRDAALVFSGQLDRTVGGQGYRDVRHYQYKGSNFYESITETDDASRRRTIYRFAPRGGRNPFLDTFDCPDPSVTTPQRAETTTPLQSLALMNNELVFSLSDRLAARIRDEAGPDLTSQLNLAMEMIYGRIATAEDSTAITPFVAQYGLESLCRVMLNSNEFLYVR